MRRLACVVMAMGFASIGCGDDNHGTGGSGGIVLPDGGGGMGGMGGGGGSAGMGMPAGTMLSSIGGQQVNVSKDGTTVAFLDTASPLKVHVVPAAGGTTTDLPFTNLLGQYPYAWVAQNVLIVQHDADTSNGVAQVSFWSPTITTPVTVTASLNQPNANG